MPPPYGRRSRCRVFLGATSSSADGVHRIGARGGAAQARTKNARRSRATAGCSGCATAACRGGACSGATAGGRGGRGRSVAGAFVGRPVPDVPMGVASFRCPREAVSFLNSLPQERLSSQRPSRHRLLSLRDEAKGEDGGRADLQALQAATVRQNSSGDGDARDVAPQQVPRRRTRLHDRRADDLRGLARSGGGGAEARVQGRAEEERAARRRLSTSG